jgi:hypothetical protein
MVLDEVSRLLDRLGAGMATPFEAIEMRTRGGASVQYLQRLDEGCDWLESTVQSAFKVAVAAVQKTMLSIPSANWLSDVTCKHIAMKLIVVP